MTRLIIITDKQAGEVEVRLRYENLSYLFGALLRKSESFTLQLIISTHDHALLTIARKERPGPFPCFIHTAA